MLLNQAKEIIELFKEYKVQILSNGFYISNEMCQYIINQNIDLQITLNGSNEGIDNIIRVNAFKNTLHTIRTFIKLGGKENLKINYSISKKNKDDIESMIRLCIKENIKHLQFSFMFRQGRAIENWDEFKLTQFEKLKIMDSLKEFKNKYRKYLIISFSGLAYYISSLNHNKEISCSSIREEIMISSNGNLNYCYKLNTYLDCNKIKNQSNISNFNNSYSIPFYFFKKCDVCEKIKGCVVSCLRK